MKKKVFALVFAALLGISAFPGWSVGDESPVVFDIPLRLLGADLGVGYRGFALLPGTDTTLWAYAGGGYEWLDYFRDPSGAFLAPGSLATGGALDGWDSGYVRIEGAWRLGIDQGLAWNERTKTNRVSVFAFYRGRWDLNFDPQPNALLTAANIPESQGILQGALQAGLTYDDLLFDTRHKTRSGLAAELTAEWGPVSPAYARFNGNLRFFKPLYDIAPDRPVNLLSVYIGDFVSLDYAMGLNGAAVPLYVRQTFGGRDQIVGLGRQVRGVDWGSLDANLKAANSLEVRANLPALFLPDLVPGVVAFWDIGYYDQVGEPAIASPGTGVVSSVGAGVYIDVLDLGNLAAYVDYRLDAANATGSQWSFFAIEFGLHF